MPVVYTYFYHEISGAPKTLKGITDLSIASPAEGKIYLDGEWEIYWNHFIVSEQEQCGIEFVKREKIGFLVYYILLYLIYLLVPNSIYNQYLSVLVPMLTYVLDFYLFFKTYYGRQTMKKFGEVVLLGVIFVIAGLTVDSYYTNGKIYMNMSLTLLFFFTLFALIMNWVYAIRGLDIYDDFIKSSSRLEMASNMALVSGILKRL